jgi:hypothetical protein
MKILDRLPYFPEHRTITARGEAVRVRPYQIVVWVSVNIARLREWDSRTPAFPAILDPGNNFNFSIFQSQLIRWAGIRPELLQFLGRIKRAASITPAMLPMCGCTQTKPAARTFGLIETPSALSFATGSRSTRTCPVQFLRCRCWVCEP